MTPSVPLSHSQTDAPPHPQISREACEAVAHALSLLDGGAQVAFAGYAWLTPHIAAARFCWSNGLKVLFLPDDHAPIFAYQTWFDVGSRHEKPGFTGIAHLFEHLMFKGTHQNPTGVFDKEMEERGAQTNAATWMDWTYYREALPATGDNFETVVRYESDRMRNLALTQPLLDAEREVVKNERLQRVENSIHGELDEALYRLAFTRHSYQHPTIGSMEDLDRMTMPDFEAFYRSYYAPNHACIVVAGALTLESTLRTLHDAYAAIPAQTHVPESTEAEPAQQEIRRVTLIRPTDSARLSIAFHGPAQSDPAHIALQIAGEILCGGDSASLYELLVIDRELCQEVHAQVTPYAHPGLFQLDFLLTPEASSAECEALVVQALATLLKNGIDEAALQKAKNRIEVGFLRSLVDLESQAEHLGHFETITGDASFVNESLQTLHSMTLTQVDEALRRYVQLNAYTLALVEPQEMAEEEEA